MEGAHRLPFKNAVFAAGIVLIMLALILSLSITLASRNCNLGFHDDEDISINDQIMHLQIADTTKEQIRGLGGRSCIGDNQAMLFEFGKPADYRFWMKNMKFPIDIIWMDSNHEVVQVDANVQPSSYPKTYSTGQAVQYVLETKVGRASQLGIQNGQIISF